MYAQSCKMVTLMYVEMWKLWLAMRTNHPEMTGVVTSMQVFYYGKTGFGTEDLLCMQLKGCMRLLP